MCLVCDMHTSHELFCVHGILFGCKYSAQVRVAVGGSCSVDGLRWWASISYVCVCAFGVSCSSFWSPDHHVSLYQQTGCAMNAAVVLDDV